MWSLYRIVASLPVFFLSLDFHLDVAQGASKKEVEQHLEMGKKLLGAGQLADALSHYHAAVEGDPTNYLTYFKRATVFLAIGKSKSALPDLDKVIELKPDFTQARVQRANVLLKQGEYDDAEVDYRAVLQVDPGNQEAQQHLDNLEPIKQEIKDAKYFHERGEYQSSIDLLTRAIEVSPWDPELRELRADCYMAQGDYFKAAGDIRPTTKLRPDNTEAYFKLSDLHYNMGEADTSLVDIRECLKLDPDHKKCFKHYKRVKKLVKQMDQAQQAVNAGDWDGCIQFANKMLKTEDHVYNYVHRARSHICHCNSKGGYTEEALATCDEVLALDENNLEAICDRAEAYLQNEQYEESIKEFQRAQNIDGNNQRAQEGVNKAQKLLKQSQKRDYYKILGVKRNARKTEIMRAYRKLAAKWHPDRHDGEDRKSAEKKFMDIASAKEVLTDPEKREKFDNGEDPLDPEQQAQGGGPFWNQGFNPFGQGGYQFKFHFN